MENLFLKIFAEDLNVSMCENFTIYSVFYALSNDVIFIKSARSQKFRTSWYGLKTDNSNSTKRRNEYINK
jgi:hypothetical protein